MKQFFKRNWKGLAFWSGMGGIVAGGALVAYKKGYIRQGAPSVVPIPDDCEEVTLRMTPGSDRSREAPQGVKCCYHLHKTPFLTWSIMDKSSRGHRVFFVTPRITLCGGKGEQDDHRREPFYAVVGTPLYPKKRALMDHIQEGSPVVFFLCFVGGSSNGVLTGEKVVTDGALESWEPS